jgi:hypothetical protein
MSQNANSAMGLRDVQVNKTTIARKSKYRQLVAMGATDISAYPFTPRPKGPRSQIEPQSRYTSMHLALCVLGEVLYNVFE